MTLNLDVSKLEAHRDGIPQQTIEPSLGVSEFEQRVWLYHQQHDDGRSQYASAYHLTGEVNMGKLVAALSQLSQDFPIFNQRYLFNDALGLTKQGVEASLLRVDIEQVVSLEQAMQHLMVLQNQPIALDDDAPIRFVLYSGDIDGVVLGVVTHQILSERMDWQSVFQRLSARYNQPSLKRDWEGVSPGKSAHIGYTPLTPQSDIGNTCFAWLQSAQPELVVEQSWPATPKYSPEHSLLARKYRVSLQGSVLDDYGLSQPNKKEVLSVIAALFARYLAVNAHTDQCDLYLPYNVERRAFELNGAMIETGLIALKVPNVFAPIERNSAEILAQLNQSREHYVASYHGQQGAALVTWLVDPSVHLQLDQVNAEKSLFAAAHPKFAVTLGVGLNCQGALVLELTLAAGASPYIGAFMLEQFVAQIGGKAASSLHLHESDNREPANVSKTTSQTHEQTQAAVEAAILAEFRTALANQTMTADDDFFDFGGHSLIATRVIGRLLSDHGIEIHINDMFSFPSAKQLAQQAKVQQAVVHQPSHCEAKAAAQSQHNPIALDRAPLSLAQHSLWKAMSKYASVGLNNIFNLPFALKFLDRVDEAAFGRAFHAILLRHTGLRTRFSTEDNQPYQQVIPVEKLADYQWFWTSQQNGGLSVSDLLAQEAEYAFDLDNELPLRLRFVTDDADGAQYLSLLFHHIVLDEWSLNTMMDELALAYRCYVQGHEPQWHMQPRPFHEFARKQRASDVNQAHLSYWLNKFEGLPWAEPIFPAHHPLSVEQQVECGEGGWVEIKIPQRVSSQLYALAKARSASLFNVVYAAIAASLRLLGAPEKLIVGTPAAGRLDADYFDTVGYFTTLGVQLVDFTGVKSIWQLIEQVKNSINESMAYTDIPIDLIEEGLKGVDHDTEGHMFEVFIQLHAKNKFHGAFELSENERVRFQQVDPDKSESGLGLQFEVMEESIDGEQTLRVMMSYMNKNYSPSQVTLLSDVNRRLFEVFADCVAQDQDLAQLQEQVAALEATVCLAHKGA
ncbi:condensation domain-containing protein [Vibrio vulnificus]|uniref:condensation domain-containing protein n=1 Tax=Vibrio vulnificus TaxID=672 RepID=UPI001A27A6A1|nr:peptide synthetase [Vibrio vulnificus]HDY7490510.1 peptide synthetase [Vibrio vulnificus]